MSGKRSFVLGALVGLAVGAGVVALLTRGRSPIAGPAGRRAGARASEAAPGPRSPALAALQAAHGEADALRRQARHLRDEVSGLRARLQAIAAARDAGTDPAVAEARTLRAEVARLRGALRVESQVRESQEGKPIPFPKDLPERYRQEAMVQAVTEALRAAGVPGEVKSVDCNEYPCIVYGEVRAQGPGALDGWMRQAEKRLQGTYPSGRDHYTTSLWSTRGKSGEGVPGYFGISIFPEPGEGAAISLEELRKRMRFRQSQYTETLRPR